MKKTIIFILICFSISNIMLSQNWLGSDAKWVYYQGLLQIPNQSTKTFEVIGDTIILEKECKIIKGNCNCGIEDGINSFLYKEENRIFYYNIHIQDFILLYDFNLEEGDTLEIILHNPFILSDTLKYRIDSVGFLITDNDSSKIQYISDLQYGIDFGERHIENMGSDECFFPMEGAICGVTTGPIRCFNDGLNTSIKFIEDEVECEIEVGLSSVEVNKLKVYPNPFRNELNIDSQKEIKSIKVYDNKGNKIKVEKDIDTMRLFSDLPDGLYILQIEFQDGAQSFEKIVKK